MSSTESSTLIGVPDGLSPGAADASGSLTGLASDCRQRLSLSAIDIAARVRPGRNDVNRSVPLDWHCLGLTQSTDSGQSAAG